MEKKYVSHSSDDYYNIPNKMVFFANLLDLRLRLGFFRAAQWTLRCAEDSLAHGGPPCGTYVWVNRGTSGRSRSDPDGREGVKSVQRANMFLADILWLVDHFDIAKLK